MPVRYTIYNSGSSRVTTWARPTARDHNPGGLAQAPAKECNPRWFVRRTAGRAGIREPKREKALTFAAAPFRRPRSLAQNRSFCGYANSNHRTDTGAHIGVAEESLGTMTTSDATATSVTACLGI